MLGQECSIVYCSVYMAQASVWFVYYNYRLPGSPPRHCFRGHRSNQGGAVKVIQVQQSRDTDMSAFDALASVRSE